jgi:ketosteroid isomerase-like protein
MSNNASPLAAVAPSTTPLSELLATLLKAISEGQALAAFDRFYAQDVVMRENEGTPTVGFAANREREIAFFSSIQRWEEFTVLASGAGPTHTFYDVIMRWVGVDGKSYRQHQVVIAEWRHGRIINERFVYDSAQAAA